MAGDGPETDQPDRLAGQQKRAGVPGAGILLPVRAEKPISKCDVARGGQRQAQRHFGDLQREGGRAAQHPNAMIKAVLVVEARMAVRAHHFQDGSQFRRFPQRLRPAVHPFAVDDGDRLRQRRFKFREGYRIVSAPDDVGDGMQSLPIRGREDPADLTGIGDDDDFGFAHGGCS